MNHFFVIKYIILTLLVNNMKFTEFKSNQNKVLGAETFLKYIKKNISYLNTLYAKSIESIKNFVS